MPYFEQPCAAPISTKGYDKQGCQEKKRLRGSKDAARDTSNEVRLGLYKGS